MRDLANSTALSSVTHVSVVNNIHQIILEELGNNGSYVCFAVDEVNRYASRTIKPHRLVIC